jgi:hypothetical protein
MAAAEHAPEPTNNAAPASLAELKERYPSIREPIRVALHLLLQKPEISIDDAKAKAGAMGTRITAASINAARRLLERMDTAPSTPAAAPAATTAPTRPARRPRASEPAADAEALIRGVVAKLASQGNVEADRLRASIRRAVDLLNSALA